MSWSTFYKDYHTMADSDMRQCVINLSDIGDGKDVVGVITTITNAEIKLRLLERAMDLGAVFTESDYARLDGEVPSFILTKLAKYGNIAFGTPDAVAESIAGIRDENAKRALYERAYIDDVGFVNSHFVLMGYENIDSAHDEIDGAYDESTGMGCIPGLLFGWLSVFKKKRNESEE